MASDSASLSLHVDLLVVGGGVNGAGIARDAAGRGLSVALVERDDLAAHTSSASTKLIHGGLRYLEYGDFRLVREALIEREILWGMAPHIIAPLRFVLPMTHAPRPAWLVRAGLFLYDHIGGRRKLPGTESIALDHDPRGQALKAGHGKRAFVYSDCRVDDSRLVVLNARDAADKGAHIFPRTELVSARRDAHGWQATVSGARGQWRIGARAMVNAAGPWVTEMMQRAGVRSGNGVRLVKGSHIVIPRLYDGDHAFMLQNADRRIVFAIPWRGDFTLVGTTDEPWEGPPGVPHIDAAETAYLLETINRYFRRQVREADIVWTYSGIRPLHDDRAKNAAAVTRDYVLDIDAGGDGEAPLLSVFGGKITTYRRLAEQALDRLARVFPAAGPAWTAGAVLPGGDMPDGDFAAFSQALVRRHPGIARQTLNRLAAAYGTRAENIIGDAQSDAGLGRDFGGGLHTREIDYLTAMEWARTAEDILFRRSKLGLAVSASATAEIDAYLAESIPA